MAAPALTASAANRGGPGIQSAAWDLAWMFGALWGVALLGLGSALTGVRTAGMLIVALGPAISICHAWSTTWMVLGSPLLREQRRARPRKYALYPALIIGFCLALGMWVALFQRFPPSGALSIVLSPWMLYIGLLWVGHFWHFGQQDFGVLTLYRARAGQSDERDRRIDRLYTGAVMFVVQPIVHVSFVTTAAFGEIVNFYWPFGTEALRGLARVGAGATLLMFAAYAIAELRGPQRSLPKLAYAAVVGSHPLLLAASVELTSYPLAYAYIITYLWSHWLIAIGLVSRINIRYHQAHGESRGRAIGLHLVAVGAITGVVWLIFGKWGRYNLFNTDRLAYKDVLAAIPPELAPWIGVLFGCFLCEQLLHYYCDACLFRFRDAGVRRVVAPLVLGTPSRRTR